jgi:hypothetical protein
VLPLVLIGEEVAVFALGAFEDDLVSWQCSVLVASYQLSAISYQVYQALGALAIGLPDS